MMPIYFNMCSIFISFTYNDTSYTSTVLILMSFFTYDGLNSCFNAFVSVSHSPLILQSGMKGCIFDVIRFQDVFSLFICISGIGLNNIYLLCRSLHFHLYGLSYNLLERLLFEMYHNSPFLEVAVHFV